MSFGDVLNANLVITPNRVSVPVFSLYKYNFGVLSTRIFS